MTRITDWVPGINLITYKMYNGTYPTVEKIKQMMNNMQNIHHRDWMLNNMILQGNKIALIDNYDPFEKGSTAKKPSPSRVQEMLSLMDNKDLDSFTHFFIGANN